MNDQPKWKWRVRVKNDEATKELAEELGMEAEAFKEGTSTYDSFDEVVTAIKRVSDLVTIEYVIRIDRDLEEVYRE